MSEKIFEEKSENSEKKFEINLTEFWGELKKILKKIQKNLREI